MKQKKITLFLIIIAIVLLATMTIVLIGGYKNSDGITYDYTRDRDAVAKYEKTLRVGADKDFPPFTYIDENGNPCGHSIQMIYAMAKEMECNIELTMDDWSDIQTGFYKGNYDILIAADYSSERSGKMLFSDPICSDEYVFFVKKGNRIPDSIADMKDFKIAVQEGGSEKSNYIVPMKLTENARYYSGLTEAFEAVEKGECDAVISSYVAGEWIIGLNDFDLRADGDVLYTSAYYFVYDPYDFETGTALNAAVKAIRDSGELGRINDRWIKRYENTDTFIEYLEDNLLIVFVVVLSVVIIVSIVIVSTVQTNRRREKNLYNTDTLTGLHNMKYFLERAERLVKMNPDTEFVIARLDIDNFKAFNRIKGTEEGDRLLSSLGNQMKELFQKKVDRTEIGYFGADQFVVISPRYLMFENKDKICDGFYKFISDFCADYHFSISVGFCDINLENADISGHCDMALIAAKQIKGDVTRKWSWYDDTIKRKLEDERDITDKMHDALRDGCFVPFFQPQYNYATGEMVGAEALVRWADPVKGLIPPYRFIPVFEKTGFIYEMDKVMWRNACKALKRWKDMGIKVPHISVNISRADIYHSDMPYIIKDLVEEYSIEPKDFHLEITESAYMQDPKLLLDVVDKLHTFGFIIEMDDFGSGYSSLTVLKDLPFDTVKLDMGFLKDGGNTGKAGNILSAIIRMTNQIDLPIIAEGVEIKDQAEFLKSVGCLYMQGYLFSKPVSETEFEAMLREGNTGNIISSIEGTSLSANFLDMRTQEALLFNSFVGGAIIAEYYGDKISCVRANDRVYEVLNIPREKVRREVIDNLLIVLDDENSALFRGMFDRSAENKNESEESIQFFNPISEQNMWLHFRARLLTDKGDSKLYYLTVSNITEVRELSRKTAELNTRLNTLVNNLPGGVAGFKYKGNALFDVEIMNEEYARMRGYTIDELIEVLGGQLTEDAHPDDRNMIMTTAWKCHEDGKKRTIKYRAAMKDGTYLWVECNASYVRELERLYLFVKNVNEEQELKGELQKARNELVEMAGSIGGGSVVAEILEDGKLSLISISDGIETLGGYTEEEYRSAFAKDGGFGVYEPDREKFEASYKQLLETGNDNGIEFRFYNKAGNLVWVRRYGKLICENDRKFITYVYFNMASDYVTYQSIIDDTDTGVMVFDKGSHMILYANNTAAKMYGTTPENLIGRSHFDCDGIKAPCQICGKTITDEGIETHEEIDGRNYRVFRKPMVWKGVDTIITYLYDETAVRQVAKSKTLDTAAAGAALRQIYPVSVYCNLTYNKYRVMEFSNLDKIIVEPSGSYDVMIKTVSDAIPEGDDRKGFETFFSGEALMREWKNGRETLTLEHRQYDRHGILHWVETTAIRVLNPISTDIIQILVSRCIDDRKKADEALRRRLDEASAELGINEKETVVINTLSARNRIICRYDVKEGTMLLPKKYAVKHGIGGLLKNLTDDDNELFSIAADDATRERLRRFFDEIKAGRPYGFTDGNYKLADGSICREQCEFITVFDGDDKPARAVIAVEDITYRNSNGKNEPETAEEEQENRVDYLTGLYTRRRMMEIVSEIANGERERCVALYSIDIDFFKEYNQKYGHTAGDECLRRVSSTILDYGRYNDIMFFRYSGDRFIGFGFDKSKKPSKAAGEIVAEVGGLNIPHESSSFGKVTVSVGFTCNGDRYEAMAVAADSALEKSKSDGRNRYAEG